MAINIYELKVRAMCPIHDNLTDCYRVIVKTSATIKVEVIIEWFKQYASKQILQEDLTQESAVAIGAEITTEGWHAGVKVTCHAP